VTKHQQVAIIGTATNSYWYKINSRLRVHVYSMYVTKLPLWLLQKPALRVPTRTSDRM